MQNDEVSTELEDLRDLAKTRLEELEKLNENFIMSQQELEKLKLEVSNDVFVVYISTLHPQFYLLHWHDKKQESECYESVRMIILQ